MKIRTPNIWTESLKRRAKKDLLDIANSYEVKERKFLKNVKFVGKVAKYSGNAHNYSVTMEQVIENGLNDKPSILKLTNEDKKRRANLSYNGRKSFISKIGMEMLNTPKKRKDFEDYIGEIVSRINRKRML